MQGGRGGGGGGGGQPRTPISGASVPAPHAAASCATPLCPRRVFGTPRCLPHRLSTLELTEATPVASRSSTACDTKAGDEGTRERQGSACRGLGCMLPACGRIKEELPLSSGRLPPPPASSRGPAHSFAGVISTVQFSSAAGWQGPGCQAVCLLTAWLLSPEEVLSQRRNSPAGLASVRLPVQRRRATAAAGAAPLRPQIQTRRWCPAQRTAEAALTTEMQHSSQPGSAAPPTLAARRLASMFPCA